MSQTSKNSVKQIRIVPLLEYTTNEHQPTRELLLLFAFPRFRLLFLLLLLTHALQSISEDTSFHASHFQKCFAIRKVSLSAFLSSFTMNFSPANPWEIMEMGGKKQSKRTYSFLQASWSWLMAWGISPHSMFLLPCATRFNASWLSFNISLEIYKKQVYIMADKVWNNLASRQTVYTVIY